MDRLAAVCEVLKWREFLGALKARGQATVGGQRRPPTEGYRGLPVQRLPRWL